jgi:hypothetical protein
MNRIADDDHRPLRWFVGVTVVILVDDSFQTLERAFEIVETFNASGRGRVFTIGCHQEAGDPCRRVVSGVTLAVLNCEVATTCGRDRCFVVREYDFALREAVTPQPAKSHVCRVGRARGNNQHVVFAEEVDRFDQERRGNRMRGQAGRWSIGRVHPIADLDRHIESRRIDECALGQLDFEMRGRSLGKRPRMFGEDAVDIDRDFQLRGG